MLDYDDFDNDSFEVDSDVSLFEGMWDELRREDKSALRAEIHEQTLAFLLAGGTIEYIPYGKTTLPHTYLEVPRKVGQWDVAVPYEHAMVDGPASQLFQFDGGAITKPAAVVYDV